MATARRRARAQQVPFSHEPVLHRWLLSLLPVERLEELALHLRQERLEGGDENNVPRFHHVLTVQLFNTIVLPAELPDPRHSARATPWHRLYPPPRSDARRQDLRTIVVFGPGRSPNRQACEFDHSGSNGCALEQAASSLDLQ